MDEVSSDVPQPETADTQNSSEVEKKKRFWRNPRYLIVEVLVFLVVGGWLFNYVNGFGKGGPSVSYTPTPSPTAYPSVSPGVSQYAYEPQFATGLKALPDLDLLVSTDPNFTITAKYYSAGTVPSGTYKGYKRIIAEEGEQTPSGQRKYIFATNDDKTYIAQGNPDDAKLHPESSDWGNPYHNLNRKKVVKVDDILDSLPQEIKLDETFSLFRDNANYPYTQEKPSGKKDEYGNDALQEYFVTDFSSYHKLPTEDSQHTYYFMSRTYSPYQGTTPTQLTQDQKTYAKYMDGNTEVIVLDSQGLAYIYTLTTPQAVKTYLEHKKVYDQDYYDVQIAHTKKDYMNLGSDYLNFPSLSFKKEEASTSNTLYKSYGTVFPQACGGLSATGVMKNLSDSDLVEIGKVYGRSLYTLRDENHALNVLEYDRKVNSYDKDSFSMANPDTARPSLATYITKHPLLFIKDYWGRTVAFGEFEYQILGGCGKPVIYLYPPRPTEVTVRFDSNMQLDTDIPTYHQGWDVLAHPDGILTDLKPQFTDCDEIDTTHSGSEYAKEACKQNQYPYLYWSGRSLDHEYISPTQGWVIPQTEVKRFLEKTLDEVGFTQKEKSGMLSYWVPVLLSKNTPYYRIAFLQTSQMNAFAPMTVTPRPDSVYRLFLDWTPLAEKPEKALNPQSLEHVRRQGFTLVEWGGLKQ